MTMIEGFELSSQQKHLWKLQDSSPNLPYRAQCAVQIKGKIESNALKAAIEQAIVNHEILRTTFNRVSGMTLPLQVISPDATFNFTEYDYTGIELEVQLTQLEFLLREYRQIPLDFSQNLLFHAVLVTLSEEESLLVLNLPALYVDIKGLDNLVLKISSYYSAHLKGEEILDEVLQYADISEWQNQLLDDGDEELVLAKGYWSKHNIIDYLSIKLPFEKQFSRKIGFEPRYLKFTISHIQVEQISEFLQKKKVKIDTFFLACWQLLLWRITQQSKVVVGVGCENRKFEELQDSVGLLARYVPLISNLQEGLLFEDILKQIQLELDNVYFWQERFGWELIVDENKSYINTAFIPFAFDFNKLDNHIADNIYFSIVKHDICFDKFKVKLSLTLNQDNLVAQLYYDSKLFDEDYIQCLAGQFETLLSSILNCPDTVIEKIGILSDVEREEILLQFNATSCDYPKDKCIHQLFEEQVEKTPDTIAVVFENQQLTYHQLNQRANQLAAHLQSLGVGSDGLVGICLQRSLEMVVGLLGILKSGSAYVPLDPNYPQERLSYMLADSGVDVLLTQQSLLATLPESQVTVVCLDDDWGVIEQKCGDNLQALVKSDNLAYAIYTSGSTGQPKGVAIEHKSLVNYVCSIIATINIEPRSNFALVSTISADLGNTVIFPCLLTGGCLHVISQEKVFDPNALSEYFSRYDIGYLKIVPSHLASLQASLDSAASVLPSKTLILGGEASSSDWIETIQVQSHNCNIINHYGPTEATVGVLTYALEQNSLPLSSPILPIGRPIANTQIYILDKQLQPLPIGFCGELHIGGDCLARGYLNHPELTQEKFIPNPFHNSKLYKTGDLARYLPDGNIEFLGRIDHQVKIRGFRIELGEIEAVVNTHPQVQQAVVIATEDTSGDKRLVAYIVTIDRTVTPTEIREFIFLKLPEYMVPSSFVILDALPLTPNGKIDIKALPAPDGKITRVKEYIAPRTQNEEIIANIFAAVLGVQNVSIHDNFFELGGHSLLATQVTSRLRQTFSVELSIPQIFESPTVAGLAEAITQLQLQDAEDEDIADLLVELEELSDEDAQRILAQENQLLVQN
ncbi:non-ribosomal peptide synthetase [Nostoc sp. 'Peltigera membranacea cyanobiont' 232]|uniref:non-ribosomal peptide synthetase n=1 Tax=Nostoc sp. 'Peltigera membranacea cyanobiont' 232 TaxID=2014531 RepID=UPI000B954A11|nr:non-ribosomal peptide synthetase [Nostoc sp. 'Peltigera membranacea cyanobiont' 232]OYE04336.1 hypothetical protein CDG79_13730 [Nostoc sp. 'Peltigera membranacea cyanobiont' 232]